ncbi:MAG: hypothetical protein ACYDCO_26795 [Armatimonadota bacterium]
MFGFLTGVIPQLFLQSVVVWVAASVVTIWLLRPAGDRRMMVLNAAVIAIGGTMAFQIPVWVLGFLPLFLNFIAGFVLFWVVVSGLLDHFYDIHYDQSYTNTGQIVVSSLLLWMIVNQIVYRAF